MADIPDSEMSDPVLLRIAEDIAFLRAVVEELLPLAKAIRGNGQAPAIRAAGMRRALRKTGTR